jgi:dTDP-L-rhamnose 4-epimerase
MPRNILVTGGAGFIGSHLVDALVARGHAVRILDNLEPQVHGEGAEPPDYLNPAAEFLRGDVRRKEDWLTALDGIDVVFHQAAAVGVAQSMYDIHRYVDVNAGGTAMLFDVLANEDVQPEKVIVASSMSCYGESLCECDACGKVEPELRPKEQMENRDWELHCPSCGETVWPVPTPETKSIVPTTVYALTKYDQERLALMLGQAYNIPTVALRYFCTYGPRQALSNPYTGAAAIFSARILNDQAPLIYEDGLQTRDFTNVRDIVAANLLAMENPAADYHVFNVGTGRAMTVLELANLLIDRLGGTKPPEVVGKFREGDIRHCTGDISRIRDTLGYEPTVRFEDGVDELAEWVRTQTAADRVQQATAELHQKNLIH